ncbi:MAG: penicillin acylase family protein [Methylococcaceae bacterium]|nr:penicillin acylase family protein [Methylococcaceae bacterium]
MPRIGKTVYYPLLVITVLAVITIGVCLSILLRSMPELDGEFKINGLSDAVTVNSDQHAIPVIRAKNRTDSIRALGFLTARDRLFQMDLMRRKNAGRLSEIFGLTTVQSDTNARIYGFNRVAKTAFANLPKEHQNYLAAYADGVNSYLKQAKALPFEFTLLNYQPEPWQAEDSLLVILGMFEMLTSWAEGEERMLSVMEKNLPLEIMAFLTPDTDRFTDSLYRRPSWRPAQAIPVAALEKILAQNSNNQQKPSKTLTIREFVVGSNAWVVSGKITQDGRAILANDMHLDLSVPNIWYRAEVNYGNTHAAGVFLPGTPILVSGSSEHIAWGNTNLTGDFLDLVKLDINPKNADEYKVGNHWQHFDNRKETIVIKDAKSQTITVKNTIWGPVAAERLLDKLVAIHWTALDEKTVNIGLIDLEQTETLTSALDIANHTSGPQLNFLIADSNGHIAWTIMGNIPNRLGIDGSVSRTWSDGSSRWNGYVNAKELPREIDPAVGFLVSANDRRLGKNYPYVIGHQFVPGYRAYRISQRLKQMQEVNEWSLFQLQLDTEIEFYSFYQQLALSVLSPNAVEQRPELNELRDYLLAWNGRADTDSLGFALLQQFREQLASTVFTPFLTDCKKADKNFEYSWLYFDTPLQALLTAKIPQLLPDPIHYKNWDDFILAQIQFSASWLKENKPNNKLSELTWGKLNKSQIMHPILGTIPFLGQLLNMPEDELAGCGGCVRATSPNAGASERLVVSPAHLNEGILHMPGGQSAHPFSPYYRDQQSYWVQGLQIPFLAGSVQNSLTLKPAVKNPKTEAID